VLRLLASYEEINLFYFLIFIRMNGIIIKMMMHNIAFYSLMGAAGLVAIAELESTPSLVDWAALLTARVFSPPWSVDFDGFVLL